MGLALVYALFALVLAIFVQASFISYISYVKGNGVLAPPEQYPDLYDRLQACCRAVSRTEVPDTYLLRTDFFNALATRFLRRHCIALFTVQIYRIDRVAPPLAAAGATAPPVAPLDPFPVRSAGAGRPARLLVVAIVGILAAVAILASRTTSRMPISPRARRGNRTIRACSTRRTSRRC